MKSMRYRPSSFLIATAVLGAWLTLAGSPQLGTAADALSARLLFNGRNLDGWRKPAGDWMVVGSVSSDPSDPRKFATHPGNGVLVNGAKGRTENLVSELEHGDVEAHIELCIPKNSNSGIYFMGRYEIQVYDSFGVEKDKYPGIECGGIYPRWTEDRGEFEGHSPSANVSRPAGQWQSFDVVFRAPRFDASGKKVDHARFVRVVHNGTVVHENVEVTGPTRAALYIDERPLGPLLLQGDHGPVAYRNLQFRTIESK